MGAALKVDPTRIRVTEFWKVQGCRLGAVLRKRMKRNKQRPGKPIRCVYSEEMLENRGSADALLTEATTADVHPSDANSADQASAELNAKKKQVNGSLVHITAIFGFTLAGLIIDEIINS